MTQQGASWQRRFPPVVSSLTAVLLALFVLPSALNVPQSNPTQTLEFAPVPPEDDDPPPPPGANVATLSLGESSTAPGEAVGDDGPGLPPPPPPPGVGDRPITKRCVGSPPRQTEDELSPPCVAHFEGDNGGATTRGVTEDEVRVIVYFDGDREQVTARGIERQPTNTFIDIDAPPPVDDYVYTRLIRSYVRWFNDRYQLYGRRAHVWVHYGTSVANRQYSQETRRADAAAGLDEVDPFAVITFAGSFDNAYLEAMAQGGVIAFHGLLSGISSTGFTKSFFDASPGRIWSFVPSVEQRADAFADYVCTKVVPFPVSFSGNGDNGQPRQLAMLRLVNEARVGDTLHGERVRARVEDCGGEFLVDATFTAASSDAQGAAVNIATMQREQVSTVLFSSASDLAHSKAAGAIDYHPEWVVAGDYVAERPLQSRLQDQDVWAFARTLTHYPAVTDVDDQPCVNAFREVDADEPRFNLIYGCDFYPSLNQLFTGLQVAGPNLTPQSMDRGFHAIPAIESPDPAVPACFYGIGDYTCVKDAQAQWWDPGGSTPGSNQPGCMRMIENGRRHLIGDWPREDIDARTGTAATDPCNSQGPDAA